MNFINSHISALNPIWAIGGIAMLSILAAGLGTIIPFYRKQLRVEEKVRLMPLDGLRGILCFGVMYHYSAITHGFLSTNQWLETPAVSYILMGQTAVAMFFAITAFLFWGQAIDRGGEIPVWSFFRGRWFRIWPLYILATVAALWIIRHQLHWHQHHTWLIVFKMGLMGLCNWAPLEVINSNMVDAGVTWTLQYEWAFYLALPALALMVRSGGAWRIWLLVLAAWALLGVDQDLTPGACFVTRILAAHVARMPRTAAVLRHFLVAFPVLGLLGVMPLLVSGGYGWKAFLMTTAAFVPIACGNSLLGILNFRGLRMMGLISYSVYLLHGMFLYVARPTLRIFELQGKSQYWLAILCLACIVLIGCSITYATIEWPFMQMEKWLRRRGKSAGALHSGAVPRPVELPVALEAVGEPIGARN